MFIDDSDDAIDASHASDDTFDVDGGLVNRQTMFCYCSLGIFGHHLFHNPDDRDIKQCANGDNGSEGAFVMNQMILLSMIIKKMLPIMRRRMLKPKVKRNQQVHHNLMPVIMCQ